MIFAEVKQFLGLVFCEFRGCAGALNGSQLPATSGQLPSCVDALIWREGAREKGGRADTPAVAKTRQRKNAKSEKF
jgi:hypothetical protein